MSAYAQEPEPHTHGYAEPVPPDEPATRPGVGGLAVRVSLTLLGAAGMIVGSFMPWITGAEGTTIDVQVFWSTATDAGATFVTSAGFVTIVLGLLAVVGLAPRSGALTSLAGALGIVAMVMLGITLYRADAGIEAIEAGAWLCLAGAVVAMVGGFFGTRPQVVHQVTTTDPRQARVVP